MSDAYICAGLRSPFGRYGGSLSQIRPDDLATQVIAALLERLPPAAREEIDEVILGCANQAGEDNRNVARMALLLGGLPETVPGVTVNRLCASGAEAIGTAARMIRCGEAHLVIAGGVESMTRAPLVMPKSPKAWSRVSRVEDTTIGWRFVNSRMEQAYGTHSMPETAENVADEFDVSRADQDAFALSSQERVAHATKSGRFEGEIATIKVSTKSGSVDVATDEHPRPETTIEDLARLSPIVRDSGTVTAGNASGVNDGAAVLLIASTQAIRKFGLQPLAKVTAMCSAGVAPKVMGIGPVAATRKLLAHTSWDLRDVDLFEINEAFAAQVIASMRELGVDPLDDSVNPHGGAIALGHPLGASGARLALSAARDISAGMARRAVMTMCVGVGQGVSIALEAP